MIVHAGAIKGSCETEIGDMCNALMQEDVRGFNVSVNDVVLVEFFETFADLAEILDGFAFGEFATSLFEEFLEIAVCAILEEHVQVVRRSCRVVEFHDVRVVDLLENLDFTSQKLNEIAFCCDFLQRNDFHCDLLCMVVLQESLHD